MSNSKIVKVPLNRVEGDLEIRTQIEDGIIVDAWSSGTMFRGFERILVGRGPLDGLVITPRICGICGTAHLTAAARALDAISNATLPPDAVRIRNLALMAEHIQSDIRHGFLMFTADFVNPAYKDNPLFEEAVRRYQPFKGETVIEVVRKTKKVLEIIAILGGQWPHSSYMVPGGVVSIPSAGDLMQCALLLKQYRNWYEERILGCKLERILEIQTGADMENWLEENDSHRNSELGFYIRYAREIGLDKIGKGHGTFLSFGSLDLPEGSRVIGPAEQPRLVPAGFARDTKVRGFDQEDVSEHVAYSWFEDYEGGRHPFRGETRPYATGQEGDKYSWAKAPRYDGRPAETGPLAEAVIAKQPMVVDLLRTGGTNVFLRELARLIRPTSLIPAMENWFKETSGDGKFYEPPGEIEDGEGYGLTQAARGALGHWVKIKNGAIDHYQIITPTAWNASPRDSDGTRGPLEQALVGTKIADMDNPVEMGHVARSFDLCLVCTVHMVNGKRTIGRTILGATP
jgi:uptake hydrogenase large subunit